MSGPKLPTAYLHTVLHGNVDAGRIVNALENEGFKGTDALQALELVMSEHPEGTRYCLTAKIGPVQGASDVDGKRLIQMRVGSGAEAGIIFINVTQRGPGQRGDPLPRKVEVVHRDQRRTDWRPASQTA